MKSKKNTVQPGKVKFKVQLLNDADYLGYRLIWGQCRILGLNRKSLVSKKTGPR